MFVTDNAMHAWTHHLRANEEIAWLVWYFKHSSWNR